MNTNAESNQKIEFPELVLLTLSFGSVLAALHFLLKAIL